MSFEPHPLLRGPNRQTIFGAFARLPPALPSTRERFELPDGDFVDLYHSGPRHGPRVVLVHGLAGHARSPYMGALGAALGGRGWAVTRFEFRGAGETPNRLARGYHSGDTADLARVARTLRERDPAAPLCAVGFSLGANVLLKLMAEEAHGEVFDAAVAVSVPFRLAVCADRLATGTSRVYGRWLLTHLKQGLRRKRTLLASRIDLPGALAATDFRTFDALVTAPLHGYASVDDYYARASCRPDLARITRPTLILHAADDPFMLPTCVPEHAELSPRIELEVHRHGGHVGFFERGPGGLPRSYLERRVGAWLDAHRGPRAG